MVAGWGEKRQHKRGWIGRDLDHGAREGGGRRGPGERGQVTEVGKRTTDGEGGLFGVGDVRVVGGEVE